METGWIFLNEMEICIEIDAVEDIKIHPLHGMQAASMCIAIA